MRKSSSAILLILCLVAPVVSTYFVMQFQKNQIKREVKWKIIAGLDREELVLLKFSKVESEHLLRWEHEGEFEFEGEMYDVVEREVQGDSLFFWCWWDHKETALNLQLNDLTAIALGNNPERKEHRNNLTDFFKKLYCNPFTDITLSERSLTTGNFHCIKQLSSRCFSPPFPPPEQA